MFSSEFGIGRFIEMIEDRFGRMAATMLLLLGAMAFAVMSINAIVTFGVLPLVKLVKPEWLSTVEAMLSSMWPWSGLLMSSAVSAWLMRQWDEQTIGASSYFEIERTGEYFEITGHSRKFKKPKLIDCGPRHFLIEFSSPISGGYFASISAQGSSDWQEIEKGPSHIEFKFLKEEPKKFQIELRRIK